MVMKTRPYLLHALSPLHAGTGQAVDVIDLPIARMASTGIPIVPGSSIKGVLRDHRRPEGTADSKDEGWRRHLAVFGPEQGNDGEDDRHAGALVVGDARLLALPVRSFRGTFAWVTSPLLLQLAARDLGAEAPVGDFFIEGRGAVVPTLPGAAPHLNVHGSGREQKIYLVDLDLPVATGTVTGKGAVAGTVLAAWAALLAAKVQPAPLGLFARRLVLVDDETMTFLWETATQIDVRNRIDPATRTVAKGALWSEESLPPETVLVGTLLGDRARRREVTLDADGVLDAALPEDIALQFGGKATVGRGRCRMMPVTITTGGGASDANA